MSTTAVPRRPLAALASATLVIGLMMVPAPPAAAAPAAPGQVVGWGSTGSMLGGGVGAGAVTLPVVAPAGSLVGRTVVQVSTANDHSCALDSVGGVHCWGSDAAGALGNGAGQGDSTVPVAIVTSGLGVTPRFVQVDVGGNNTSCALADTGQAYCWGSGVGSGLLGGGAGGGDSEVPVAVTMSGVPDHAFSSISLGDSSACGLSGGAAYCWGNNMNGEIGDGTLVSARLEPSPVLPSWAVTHTLVAISTGLGHTCALDDQGTGWCWGSAFGGVNNGDGSLGSGVMAGSRVPVALDTSVAIHDRKLASITAGAGGCALDTLGAAYCWGPLGSGIGDGLHDDGANRYALSPVAVKADGVLAGKTLKAIDERGDVCALDTAGAAYCWGPGVLGDGAAPGAGNVPKKVSTADVLSGVELAQISVGGEIDLAVVAVPPPPAGTPGPPGTPTATAGNAKATVSWTAPTDSGTSAITSYTVTASPGGATCQVTMPADLTCEVTGLTNGQSYSFVVVATNAIGPGAPSQASSPVIVSGQAGPPTNVSTNPGISQVRLTWVAPTDDGGSPVTGYQVTAAPGGATCTSTLASPRACTVTGLTNGTSYSFIVQAQNSVGLGTASDPVTATPRTSPDAPKILGVVPGDRTATITWQAPAFDGGAPITGYTVMDGSTLAFLTSCPTTLTLTCTVGGLVNGTTRTFCILATNVAGTMCSAPSEPVVIGPPPTAPGALAGLSVTGGLTEADLTWTPPADDGRSAVTGYEVSVDGAPSFTLPPTARSYNAKGLLPGQSHTFSVAATNAIDKGPAATATATATSLTLAASPTAVNPGGSVILSGVLKDATGAPVAQATVRILATPYGAAQRQVTTATTSASGAWSTIAKPTIGTTYQASFTGGPKLMGRLSTARKVDVRRVVSISVNDATAVLGQTVKFTATVKPRTVLGTVYLQVYGTSGWVSVKGKTCALTSLGTCSVSYKPANRNDYYFRFLAPATAGYVAGVSTNKLKLYVA